MQKMTDRKKMRAAYLRKKGGTYIKLMAAILFGAVFTVRSMQGIPRALKFGFANDLPPVSRFAFALLFIGGAAVLACYVALFWRTASDARRELAQIPYIPPVTAATLPAEEVLVRGSDDPIAAGDTLVRPALECARTSPEQLLRSSRVTPDSRTDGEIQVQGSEEPPVAHREILLRVVHEPEILKEELLLGQGE